MKLIAIFLALALPVQAYLIPAEGRSMLPAFPEKCMVAIRDVPYADLQAGMPVMVKRVDAKGYTIHRLKFKDWRGVWRSKGDNNKQLDMYPVTPRNYVGVAVLIWPKGGAK